MDELSARALKFEQFLDSMRDGDGLLPSDVRASHLRPWRNVDFAGYELWEQWAANPADQYRHEGETLAPGGYIRVKALRRLGGAAEPELARDAERATGAL